MIHDAAPIESSLESLERWIEQHEYKGFEPFDGLTSALFPLTLQRKLPCQLMQQGVRRFPVNIRPLLGIKPLDSTKGRGYVAWGYLKRFRMIQDERYRHKAIQCLDWLERNKSPDYQGHSWGNHFLYVSRAGFIPKYEPTIVWTGLIGQAFIEAYTLFKERRHLDVIISIADWIMALPREPFERGLCLSYIMPRQSSIHNANMIGAAYLAGAAAILGKREYQKVAREAMEYSCSHQGSDGSWFYGEAPMHHWVDAFHTGYNLDSLKRYMTFSGDDSFNAQLYKGFEYFQRCFFENTGRVKYYADKARPIDIQCASQAIDTLSLFSDVRSECCELAIQTARWYIKHMQDADGHYYFRKGRLGVINKTAMIHWGQATMYKALANLLLSCPEARRSSNNTPFSRD